MDRLRVLYQSFGPAENRDYLDRLGQTLAVCGRLFDVEVDVAPLRGTLLTQKQHRAFHLAAGAQLLEQLYHAQAKGYAAAVIGNIQDPALYESRQVLTIPVLGLLESGLVQTRTFATSLALITTSRLTMPLLRERVRQYGDEARVRAWRTIEIPLPRLLEAFSDDRRGARIWDDFVATAKLAAADGAELIVPASGMLTSFLCVRAGDAAGWDVGAGAPVVNPVFTAIAAAASAARLARAGLPVSRAGTYASPDPDVLRQFFRSPATPPER
ncbi:MAG TPA: aspartate/glutamate racemase family protein [Candidatus Limnocylindria bacterium]|nr:aspartate/glutamate racemase family protein [Candidatus Limnocylindria bacterium]